MIETIRPQEIERRSFEIIGETVSYTHLRAHETS